MLSEERKTKIFLVFLVVWKKTEGKKLLIEIFVIKAMVFPVVMYVYKRWTIKKAEHKRIDALELWSWRRLLKVPWTARRSNQSITLNIYWKN